MFDAARRALVSDAVPAYAERMGWDDLPWYTITSDAFTEDFGATEWFALNVFLRDGDDVYRTYFLQNGPMVRHIGSVASLLALTPYGGQIEGEDVPEGWPQAPFSFWMVATTSTTSPHRRPATDQDRERTTRRTSEINSRRLHARP